MIRLDGDFGYLDARRRRDETGGEGYETNREPCQPCRDEDQPRPDGGELARAQNRKQTTSLSNGVMHLEEQCGNRVSEDVECDHEQ